MFNNAVSLEKEIANLKFKQHDTYVNIFIKFKLNKDVKTSATADNTKKLI